MDRTLTRVGVPDLLALDQSKHVKYTFGMVLGVDDFTQEFAWLSGRDRWLARDLIGYGTVWGLRIGAGPDPADADHRERVLVSHGVAVTPLGELVCVRTDQCAYVGPWLRTVADRLADDAPAGGVVPAYVVLCYREKATDDVPIPGEPCRSEDGLMAPSRLQDDFSLELRLDPPPQVEEDAIRAFVGWYRQIPVLADGGSTLEELLAVIRDAAEIEPGSPPDEPSPSDPPASPGFDWPSWGEGIPGTPPDGLAIPAGGEVEYRRAALRLWATDLRPRWRLGVGCASDGCAVHSTGSDADCLLLAQLGIPITWDSGTPITTGDPITIDEDSRPYLLHARMLQELLVSEARRGPTVTSYELLPSWPDTPSDAPSGAASAAGSVDGPGRLAAAGRVGPGGGLTTPPQFGTPGLDVQRLAHGVYRLSWTGYDVRRDYVLDATPITSLADAPRVVERVVDGAVSPALDPALGLHLRISTITGSAVDSAFTFRVTDFTAVP